MLMFGHLVKGAQSKQDSSFSLCASLRIAWQLPGRRVLLTVSCTATIAYKTILHSLGYAPVRDSASHLPAT